MAGKSHLCHGENAKKEELRFAVSTSFETNFLFACKWLFWMIDLIRDISICPSISFSDSFSYILREQQRRKEEKKNYFTKSWLL